MGNTVKYAIRVGVPYIQMDPCDLEKVGEPLRRAERFHVGDLVEIDFAERQLDILEHSIHFTQVNATPKCGPDQTFMPEQWESMDEINRLREGTGKVDQWFNKHEKLCIGVLILILVGLLAVNPFIPDNGQKNSEV